jgi:hypothetical protein
MMNQAQGYRFQNAAFSAGQFSAIIFAAIFLLGLGVLTRPEAFGLKFNKKIKPYASLDYSSMLVEGLNSVAPREVLTNPEISQTNFETSLSQPPLVQGAAIAKTKISPRGPELTTKGNRF